MAISIKKGDKVMILAGKDKGKTGIVERVFSKTGKIIVGGANIAKKHVKVSKKNPSGGLVEIAMPMLFGKTLIVCPNCGKPTRIGWQITGKEKNRVCKKCKKVIKQSTKAEEK
jgi:large subunit ribosomal protein L24